MSTVIEIETALSRLTPQERREVLLFLAESLRKEGLLPEPRDFSLEEMTKWMDEDEADMRRIKGTK